GEPPRAAGGGRGHGGILLTAGWQGTAPGRAPCRKAMGAGRGGVMAARPDAAGARGDTDRGRGTGIRARVAAGGRGMATVSAGAAAPRGRRRRVRSLDQAGILEDGADALALLGDERAEIRAGQVELVPALGLHHLGPFRAVVEL